jgi:hypothetical protein
MGQLGVLRQVLLQGNGIPFAGLLLWECSAQLLSMPQEEPLLK